MQLCESKTLMISMFTVTALMCHLQWQTKMYLNVQNVLTKCNYNLQNTNVYYICKSITVPAYQEYTHSRSCSILNNLNDQDI